MAGTCCLLPYKIKSQIIQICTTYLYLGRAVELSCLPTYRILLPLIFCCQDRPYFKPLLKCFRCLILKYTYDNEHNTHIRPQIEVNWASRPLCHT